MRRFVRKLVLALVLSVLGFVGGLLLLLAHERRSYVQSIRLPDGNQSVVCLSDSITVYSLNPEFWPELVNLSSEASSMDVQLMKLKDILEQNPGKIHKVLLDVSFLRLAGESERPVLNEEKEGSKFFPLYRWHKCDAQEPGYALPKHPLRMAANWIRYKSGNLVKGKSDSELVQGYLRRDVSRLHSHYDSENKEALEYAGICNTQMVDVKLESWSVQMLREMLILCQRKGVDVCLVTLPLNRLIVEKLKPESLAAFDNVLDALALEFSVSRLNFLQEELDDDCFININHLNYTGGKLITEKLKVALDHRKE